MQTLDQISLHIKKTYINLVLTKNYLNIIPQFTKIFGHINLVLKFKFTKWLYLILLSLYNIIMKKSVLLITLIPSSIFLPTIVTSCNNNNNTNHSTIDLQAIINQEIARIEQLKNQLSLKIDGQITKEKIESLNPDNILANLNNWEEGKIANLPEEKFSYLVEQFDNGLKQTNDQKTLSFLIKVSYKNVSQTTSKIEIKYQLETEKPPVVPDLPVDQLFDPQGGQISNTNLEASAYKNLITSLNLLNEQTYLPSLSDKVLMEALKQKPELKDLSLTIKDDSQTLNGTLNLELKSNNQKVIIKPTTIEISGFKTFDLDNNPPLQYYDFQLNDKSWFDQKLPIDTTDDLTAAIQKISYDQWNQVLEDFKISLANNSQSFGSLNQLKANGFSFDIKAIYDDKTKQIKLTIITKFIHKKYQNQKWVDTNQVSIWNQASNRDSIVKLFTKNDLYQFIVDQTTINQEELKTKTPSYYLAKQYYYEKINNKFNTDQSLFKNTYLDDEKFIQFYFEPNTNLSLSFSQNSVSADDWNNSLSFSVALVVNDQIENRSKQFSFKDQNKAIAEILKNELDENSVQIKRGSSFETKIVNHLKTKHKAEVDELFQNGTEQETKTFNDFPGGLISQQITQALLNYENDYEKTNQIWEKVKEQIDITLFNLDGTKLTDGSFEYQESNSLNFDAHLFWLSAEDAFVIEQLKYQFSQPNVLIKLIKQGTYIKVELQGEIVIDFAGAQEKIIPTTFYFNLFKTNWTKS